jgi:hypothetical protein
VEENVTWEEFLEWSLFFEMHPFGHSWLQHARLESHISSFTCGKALDISECMPPFKKRMKKIDPVALETKMLVAAKMAGIPIIHKKKKK